MATITDITTAISNVSSALETLLGLGSGGISVNTKYSIFLDYAGETIQFPVMPEEIPIKYPSANQTYNLLAIGEIVQPRSPGLTEIKWDGFFPGQKAPYIHTSGSFKLPEFYIEKINSYKAAAKPIRLIISRTVDGKKLFDTNMRVVVEDFSVIEKGGEVGDFYYSISLKEYRDYAAKKVTTQTTTTTTTATATEKANDTSTTAKVTKTVQAITEVQRVASKVKEIYYTVKTADTLWKIAKRQLNDGSLYKTILTKNGLKDVNDIMAGKKLKL